MRGLASARNLRECRKPLAARAVDDTMLPHVSNVKRIGLQTTESGSRRWRRCCAAGVCSRGGCLVGRTAHRSLQSEDGRGRGAVACE